MIIWYIVFKISQKFQSSRKNLTFNGPHVEFAKFLIVVIVGHKVSWAVITLQSRKRTCYWYPDNGAELTACSSKVVRCQLSTIFTCTLDFLHKMIFSFRISLFLRWLFIWIFIVSYIYPSVVMITEKSCNWKINCYYSRRIYAIYIWLRSK